MKRFLLFLVVLGVSAVATPAVAQFSFGKSLPASGSLSNSRTECVILEASAINCSTSSGCATTDNAGTNFDYTSADFDSASDEDGTWVFALPDNITGTTFTAQYYWTTGTCTATTNDDACFTVAAAGVTDDEAWNGATLGTAVGQDDTCTTADDLYISPTFTVTHGWTAGDKAIVQVARDVDAGVAGCSDDNISNDVDLQSIKVCYEVDNVFSGE